MADRTLSSRRERSPIPTNTKYNIMSASPAVYEALAKSIIFLNQKPKAKNEVYSLQYLPFQHLQVFLLKCACDAIICKEHNAVLAQKKHVL